MMDIFAVWVFFLMAVHITSAKEKFINTNTLKPLTVTRQTPLQKSVNTKTEVSNIQNSNIVKSGGQDVANFRFGIGGINGGIAGGLFSGTGDTIAHHIGQNLYYIGNKPVFNNSPYGYPGRPVSVLVHNKPYIPSSDGPSASDRKKTPSKPSNKPSNKPNKLGVGNKPSRPGSSNKYGNHDSQSQYTSTSESSVVQNAQGSVNGNVGNLYGGNTGGDYGSNAGGNVLLNGQFGAEASGNNGIVGGIGANGNLGSGFGGGIGGNVGFSGGASGNGNAGGLGGGGFGFAGFRPRPIQLGFLGQGNSGVTGHGSIQGNFDSQHHASINLSGGAGGFGNGGFGAGASAFG